MQLNIQADKITCSKNSFQEALSVVSQIPSISNDQLSALHEDTQTIIRCIRELLNEFGMTVKENIHPNQLATKLLTKMETNDKYKDIAKKARNIIDLEKKTAPTADEWGFTRWNYSLVALEKAIKGDQSLLIASIDPDRLHADFRAKYEYRSVKSAKIHGKPRFITKLDQQLGLDDYVYCRLEGFCLAPVYTNYAIVGINKRYGEVNHIYNFAELLQDYEGNIVPCDLLNHPDGSSESLGLHYWVSYFKTLYYDNDEYKWLREKIDTMFPAYQKLFDENNVAVRKNLSLDLKISFADFAKKYKEDPMVTLLVYPPSSLEIQVKDSFHPQLIIQYPLDIHEVLPDKHLFPDSNMTTGILLTQ